jgi:hypothetical protein
MSHPTRCAYSMDANPAAKQGKSRHSNMEMRKEMAGWA